MVSCGVFCMHCTLKLTTVVPENEKIIQRKDAGCVRANLRDPGSVSHGGKNFWLQNPEAVSRCPVVAALYKFGDIRGALRVLSGEIR